MGSLATSGAVAVGRMFRAFAVMVVLLAVAISDSSLGLPAVIVYALAYTVELGTSLIAYYGGEAGT
jgi:heme O synthase-like polyprenyltransferase